MIRKLTQAEVDEGRREVQALRSSASMKDQICGLLMDPKIGSSGMTRVAAQAKSEAIVELVNEAMLAGRLGNSRCSSR